MSVHLQKEIENLKVQVNVLSALVEQGLEKAIRALNSNDVVLAQEVIDADDEIDRKEVEIEETCLKVLALHQPVAIDLRFVISVLKINNDLERVGDLSANIARRARYFAKHDPLKHIFDFSEMAQKTRSMLKRSLDALVRLDAKIAEQVCKDDNDIDSINKQMYDKSYSAIKDDVDNTKGYIYSLQVSRHLERIADLATNIAEDVIYMVEGAIVRHQEDTHFE